MKKKMLGIIAFAAIAAVSGWNYNQNMNNVNLSDLALENVEALASGELSDLIWIRYDYTLENGSAGVNCFTGGSSNCLLR
ncbi:MAG: hypothetical protein E7085_07135 [Parabacteroides distasonis]|nr:hypothetical protein [Parabacteroides distasonis]